MDTIVEILSVPINLIIFLGLTLALLVIWAKPLLESIDRQYENQFEPPYKFPIEEKPKEVKKEINYLKNKPIIKPPKSI